MKLRTSYKYHFTAAFLISLWLVLFLVIIAPFDTADLSFPIRLMLMPGYGIISFVAYIVLLPLQNWAFQKKKKWTLFYEILFIALYSALAWFGSYQYYISGHINGDYSFLKFSLQVYYPIFFIMLIVIIFARWYLSKNTPDKINEKITLSGDNKLDVLQIDLADLIGVSSADNYVEVHYIKDGVLQKKLLRSTLKKIHEKEPKLVQIHRSHLINPTHFKEWKDQKTIVLTQLELPVSKTYKQKLKALNFHP